MDVVAENSGHQVVPAGPNTCITPGVLAGAPGPIPYPIKPDATSFDPGTSKTKAEGKPIMNGKGSVKSLMGNQPGSQKDISTFQTGKKSWPIPVPAVNILFEGAPVTITGNPGMGNSM